MIDRPIITELAIALAFAVFRRPAVAGIVEEAWRTATALAVGLKPGDNVDYCCNCCDGMEANGMCDSVCEDICHCEGSQAVGDPSVEIDELDGYCCATGNCWHYVIGNTNCCDFVCDECECMCSMGGVGESCESGSCWEC